MVQREENITGGDHPVAPCFLLMPYLARPLLGLVLALGLGSSTVTRPRSCQGVPPKEAVHSVPGYSR